MGWLACAAAIFVLPGLWRNFESYHGLFGPREAVSQQHGPSFSLAEHADKLRLNLASSAVQLFDPNAQPWWLEDLSRSMGRRLVRTLSVETDPYLFVNVSRRAQLEQVMELREPDCDLLTCGIPSVMLFAVGFGLAALRVGRDKSAPLILVWGAGVIVFILVQHAMVQWHYWTFRFFILVRRGRRWWGHGVVADCRKNFVWRCGQC